MNSRRVGTPIGLVGLAVGAVLVLALAQFSVDRASAATTTIDFEGLAEGATVSSLDCSSGVSCGEALAGSIAVNGVNPVLAGNQAMIFDAACGGGCTGGDDDLEVPAQGNVLIVSEDGDGSDPDDSDEEGQIIDLDLSGFGPGTFTIQSLVVIDVDDEPGGTIEIFDGGPGGTLVTTVAIPDTGDGGHTTVAIGDVGDFIRVNLEGSAAIDDIVLESEVISGRMTGGGSVFRMEDGVRVTRGFEIHCDPTDLPNNLEVNWPGGNKFHLTSLTTAVCTDDPDIIQDPPPAPFDTFVGTGVGRHNGVDGCTIQFTFVDAGEPAAQPSGPANAVDTAEIIISPGGSCTGSLTVSGPITFGNLQAH